MAASYDDFHRVIAATTREAFAEIGSANVDADALAALIIALFDGLLVQWQLDPERSAERRAPDQRRAGCPGGACGRGMRQASGSLTH